MLLLFCFVLFKIGSHYVALANLDLSMPTTVASIQEIHLPLPGIEGVCHHTWIIPEIVSEKVDLDAER